MRLKIEVDEDRERESGKGALIARHCRYYLDDLEITNHLNKIAITMGVNEVNQVGIVLKVDDADIDIDALIALKAELEPSHAD